MIYRTYELILPLSEYRDTLSLEGYAIIDITEYVEFCVLDSRVKTGQVSIHTLHTTCSLGMQEHEEGLAKNDFLNLFRALAPATTEGYHHNDLALRAKQSDPKLDPDNDECLDAHAHILALVLPQNITRHIENGKLLLGKWPNILFAELNGHSREKRTVSIHILGKIYERPRTPKTTLIYTKKK